MVEVVLMLKGLAAEDNGDEYCREPAMISQS